ncbi:MAG: HD domain-containing protein [Deltaproteobacteria bacterium]|nr:HD domain-containing protein [Deltaproteobacteria bacterium]
MTVEESEASGERRDAARAALRRAARAAAGLAREDDVAVVEPEAFAALEPIEVLRELDALLLGSQAAAGLDHLRRSGALEALLPEVQGLIGLHEDTVRPQGRRDGYAHKDVWAHTCTVVEQAAPTRVLRWAALLHDVGKVRTRNVAPDGTVHFLGHAEVGARMARRVLRRLAIPAEDAATIRFLVLHHLRASQYDRSWTDSAVRRFAREMEQHLDELLLLSRADITTQRAARKAAGLTALDELARRIRELRELDAQPVLLPKGLGTALIEAFGLPPGPVVGRLRKAVEQAVERGELPMQAAAEVYVAWAREHLAGLLDVPTRAAAPKPDEQDPSA